MPRPARPETPHRSGPAAVVAVLLLGLAACSPTGMAIGAGATVGIAALQERSLAEAVSDTEIDLGIADRLFSSDADLFSRIDTRVMEGRVMLTGKVADPAGRDTAVRIAWSVPGVREVIDEIQVSQGSSMGTLPGDMLAATTLRARLLADFDVADINYKIDAVDGTVYVLGVAQTVAEIDRVTAHAREVPGVKRVAMHAITVDDARRLAARPAGAPPPVPFAREPAGPRRGHALVETQARPDIVTGQLPLRSAASQQAASRPDAAAAIETASVSGQATYGSQPDSVGRGAGGIESQPLPPLR